MRLHQMITPYLEPQDDNAVSDGMDWVRMERIDSLIASQGAAQQVDGLTAFGLIAQRAKSTSVFLREILKSLIRAGAPLFEEDRAFEHFITNPTFGPNDLAVILKEMIEVDEVLQQTNTQGENAMHLLARLHPQLLGEIEGYGLERRASLGQLFRQADLEGNLPLHRLVEAGGCIAAKPGFKYPGEQLCVALDWAGTEGWGDSRGGAWRVANVDGKTPLDLLADRIEEHGGTTEYTQFLDAYLGDIVDMARAEIERRNLDKATGPAARGRAGVRL